MWQFHRLKEKAKFLQAHRKCPRCAQYYSKDFEQCNLCSHLSDSELANLIGKRRAFRVSLGKTMIYAAALILLIMILFAAI